MNRIELLFCIPIIIIIIIFILSLVYCNYYVTAHLNIYIEFAP